MSGTLDDPELQGGSEGGNASDVAVARTVAQPYDSASPRGPDEPGGLPRTETRVLDRTSDASMLLPGIGDMVGNYKLDKKLGEGAHGAVFRAHRVGLEEQRVALKIIPATRDEVALVRQELVTLATVVHPNIVQLTDHGAEAGFAWFSMPLYEGAPLDARLNERFARGETMGLEEAHEIFHPLAGALAALHAAGFRHQDIKPENIFLARFADKEHPILLDLGVAIAKDNQRFLAGTREYFAPEQLDAFVAAMRIRPLSGPPKLSEKVDVYALATTLLLALVGVENVPGAALLRPEMVEKNLPDMWQEIEVAQRAREAEPISPKALKHVSSGAKKEISRAFKRWLAHDPQERPAAAQMARELDVLLAQRRHVEARRRRNARLGIGAAALFLVGAPVAYAGGHYAVTLQECTARVAQEAKQNGAVSTNLQQCQAQAGALKADDDSCQKSLAAANTESAEVQKSFGGKLSSCTNADQQLKSLLGLCQSDRDAAQGKDKTCEASLGSTQAQLATASAARDSAQQSSNACNAQLGTCTTNLGAASSNLAACNSSVASARDATNQCNQALGKCNGDLGTSNTRASQCQTQLQACTSTSGDLSSCRSSLSQAENALSTCRAQAGSNNAGNACQQELASCEAQLRNRGPRR